MGINHLWDTNIVIYYLQQQFPSGAEAFIDNLLKEEPPVVSAITEIELLCWRVAATEKDVMLLQHFINDAMVIELEQAGSPLNYRQLNYAKFIVASLMGNVKNFLYSGKKAKFDL